MSREAVEEALQLRPSCLTAHAIREVERAQMRADGHVCMNVDGVADDILERNQAKTSSTCAYSLEMERNVLAELTDEQVGATLKLRGVLTACSHGDRARYGRRCVSSCVWSQQLRVCRPRRKCRHGCRWRRVLRA